jgi:hypothetical protein
MGARSLSLVMLAACGGAHPVDPGSGPAQQNATKPGSPERVAQDFEHAVLESRDAYVGLFDFVAVGEYEILLHRYDLNGRLKNLPDDQKTQFLGEDGTPYPEARERRNVGNFYKILAQRTVGTGGCKAAVPRTHYGSQLATFDPLPATTETEINGEHKSVPTPPGYQKLYDDVTKWVGPGKGGVVGLTCTGGKGGLAIVYTQRPNARGYDLITIYDD